MSLRRPGPSSGCSVAPRAPGWVAVAGLFCLSGCRPPAAPPAPEPRFVRVNLGSYHRLHPSAVQLQALNREIALLERDPAVRVPPSPRPEPKTRELSMPGGPVVEEPDRSVDRARAEAEIRRDFAMRREAMPPPPLVEPEPEPLSEPLVTQPRAPVVEPEQQTGLEIQINRLTQQLELLREKPQDRLIYKPTEIRERRAQSDAARSEVNRLRREQVERLRQALAPREREVTRRPVRPKPVPPPAAGTLSPETDRRLKEQESAAVEAVRRQAALPAPGSPLTVSSPEDVHQQVRERIAGAAVDSNRDAAPQVPANRRSYAQALRQRREALQAAIARDVRAAAAVAARERGWVLADRGAAEDGTAELTRSVAEVLRGAGLGAKL